MVCDYCDACVIKQDKSGKRYYCKENKCYGNILDLLCDRVNNNLDIVLGFRKKLGCKF